MKNWVSVTKLTGFIGYLGCTGADPGISERGADPFSSSPSLLSLPVPSLPSLSSPLPFPLEVRPP